MKCERHGTEMEVDDGAPFCLDCESDPAPDLWIVGRSVSVDGFEFIGAFDDEEAAREACTSSDDFVGPAVLNRRAPEAPMSWPAAYYPRADA